MSFIKLVWVGGIESKPCIVAGKNVSCMHWVNEKMMRDNPFCLASCESEKFDLSKKIDGLAKEGSLMVRKC